MSTLPARHGAVSPEVHTVTYRAGSHHSRGRDDAMQGNGAYIRSAYHVPARRGMEVQFQGHPVRIVGFDGGYLVVLIGGDRYRIHPTWEVVYPEEAA